MSIRHTNTPEYQGVQRFINYSNLGVAVLRRTLKDRLGPVPSLLPLPNTNSEAGSMFARGESSPAGFAVPVPGAVGEAKGEPNPCWLRPLLSGPAAGCWCCWCCCCCASRLAAARVVIRRLVSAKAARPAVATVGMSCECRSRLQQ